MALKAAHASDLLNAVRGIEQQAFGVGYAKVFEFFHDAAFFLLFEIATERKLVHVDRAGNIVKGHGRGQVLAQIIAHRTNDVVLDARDGGKQLCHVAVARGRQ